MLTEKTELSTLVNIGETLEKRLNEIGVYTKAELEKLGPIEAWQRIKLRHPNKNLSARYYLYSMQGALMNARRTQLPSKVRTRLIKQARVAV